VDYKNLEVLKEEAEEGRRLGFQGKVSQLASRNDRGRFVNLE
jgi:hypothetical protein